jgi:hypothetical protein
MANIDEIGKKSEELSSKSEPENKVVKYQLDITCIKKPDGSTVSCMIQDVRVVESPKDKITETSAEVPKKETPVAEVSQNPGNTIHQETKPSDPTCDLCDALANTLKEQVAKTTAKSTETESAAAAPRWLPSRARRRSSLVKA